MIFLSGRRAADGVVLPPDIDEQQE